MKQTNKLFRNDEKNCFDILTCARAKSLRMHTFFVFHLIFSNFKKQLIVRWLKNTFHVFMHFGVLQESYFVMIEHENKIINFSELTNKHVLIYLRCARAKSLHMHTFFVFRLTFSNFKKNPILQWLKNKYHVFCILACRHSSKKKFKYKKKQTKKILKYKKKW